MEMDQAPTTSEASHTATTPTATNTTTATTTAAVEMKMEGAASTSRVASELEVELGLDSDSDPDPDPDPDSHKSLVEAATSTGTSTSTGASTGASTSTSSNMSIHPKPVPDSPSISTNTSTSNWSQQELNDRQHSRVHQVATMTGQLDQELIRQHSLVEQVTAMTGKLDQLGKNNNNNDDDNDDNDDNDNQDHHQSQNEPEEEKKKEDMSLHNELQELRLVDSMSMSASDDESTKSLPHGHGHASSDHTCRGVMQVAELAQEATCQANNNTIENSNSNNECPVIFPLQLHTVLQEAEEEPNPIAEPGTLSLEKTTEPPQLQPHRLEAERVNEKEEFMTPPPKLIKKSHLDSDVSPDSVFNFNFCGHVTATATASSTNANASTNANSKEEQAHNNPFLQAMLLSERHCDYSPERKRKRIPLKPLSMSPSPSSSWASQRSKQALHIDTGTDTDTATATDTDTYADTDTDTFTDTPCTSPSRLPSLSPSPTRRRMPPRLDPDAQRVADSTKYPSKLPSPKRSPARNENAKSDVSFMATSSSSSSSLETATTTTQSQQGTGTLTATGTSVTLSTGTSTVDKKAVEKKAKEQPPVGVDDSSKVNNSVTDSDCSKQEHAVVVKVKQPQQPQAVAAAVAVKTNESSSTSMVMAPLQPGVPTAVYIKDDVYGWLPAKVLESRPTMAIISLELPSHWADSTIICFGEKEQEHASTSIHKSLKGRLEQDDAQAMSTTHKIPVHRLRAVPWKDYTEGVLPEQNATKAKRDMVDLVQLHEAAILFNLKERHYQSLPYTRVGDILVAVNPYCWMDHLYTPQTQDEYTLKLIWKDLDKAAKDLLDYKHHYDRLGIEPHVYEVSSSAYRGLALEQTDQTILVTGESGAGKTETVKILMAHLATIPQTRPQQDGSLEEDSHSNVPMEIVSRVVSSSPVFEAFGNAKTLRNDNSSRFGKFTQLQFEMEDRSKAQQAGRSVPHTDLVGSHCTTYLLEKTRVVSHSPGERTYHIFYQLLAAPQEFKEELWPSFADCEAKDFVYLAQSGEISGHSDAALWTATQESLKLFQFQGDSLKVLMRALVIVLQLGNLVFDDHDAKSEYEEHHTMITSQNELETLAEMTGIEAQVLEETMTSSVLKTGTEVVKVKASPQQSKEWCDALAKEIYSRIFNLMIRKINEYTSVEGDGKTRNLGHISLLDIFGFEKFQVNRFEQLCINYANEKLQNKYVIDNFTQIKDEYEAEGVDLYDFGLVDNSEILELLEGRNGLIASLNEECHLPTGKNDESYVYKAKTKHRRSICFIDKKLHERTEFGIQHFAGSVVYNADKFVECNMDKLPEGIVECAAKTSNSLIQAEFETSLQNLAQEMPSKRISIKKNRFVFEKFQTQLKSLMSAMENSQTRYIRCIKPNNQLAPRKVDHACTLQQLECSGLMTAIAITRESFPNKLSYDFILDRYACLMRERDFENIGKMKLPEKVHHILSQWLESMLRKNRDGSRTMPFTCGKTQVYFKSGVQERLEVLRLEYFGKSAIVIQSMVRRVQARSRYTKAHGKVMTLQRSSRMFIEKTRFTQKRHSAIRLSAWMRGNWATQNVQDMRCERAATKIQSNYRSIAAIQRVERIRNEWAATKIQTIVRTHPLSQHFQRVRLAIVCIQKAAQARRHGLQEASIMIQTAWRAHSEQRKNQGASTIQHAYQKYVIRRGPLAKTKLKSILRRPTRNQERRVTEASSKTKSPSAVGFATEMPTTPPKSGFMYFMERSLDCLICDCPGSHPAAATAVAE